MGTVADGGWGTGKSTFHYPSSALKGTFSPGRRLSFAKWDSGFCNSGQALRAEWHEGAVRVKEESGSKKYAVKNCTRKSAFVRCSTRESIQNQWTKPHSKNNTQSFINTQYNQPQSKYNQKEQYQLQQYKEHQLKQKLRVSIKNQYTQHYSKKKYSEH